MSQILASSTSYITREEAAELAGKIFSVKKLKTISLKTEPFSIEKLGYLSEQSLLTIHAQEDIDDRESTHDCTFFAKTLAPESNAFVKRVFREESHFYGNFIPLLRNFHVESWAPQCHLVKENVLVLDDLKSQGFHLAAGKLTTKQLRAAIAALARFHASSILLEKQLKVPLTAAFPGFFGARKFKNDDGPNSRFLATGMEVGESIACDLGLDSKYVTMAYHIVTQGNHLTGSKWNVICHQDLWVNNMMFSEDDESCRLLDFQTVAYGSFATDVVQILHLNLDRATRLELENFSLELYHSVLKEVLLLNVVHLGPLVYLNKQFTEEYTRNPVLQQSYDLVSRKDFVKKVMQSDQDYRCRLEEAVKELVNYVDKNRFFQ
ncbi:uncharacterized protein LOC131669631 [Phymastichus coffea]|uniref:uncharacterized protein LOC131669631 n=1 Tax=Phymastichus coffea TaxID=108790 RepID=UPI00273AF831|nr:uncharacterized protein LOC131669631 [Phymastichus coffea]